jgi:predicted nucleic acid-binding protein
VAPVRTYIDSSVLISAIRAGDVLSHRAQAFLFDPLREYVTSDFVKIELLPKCVFHKKDDERQFFEEFFLSAVALIPATDELLAFAINEGGKTGISGLDAIHVACAVVAEAEELITAEKSTKPIHRANGVRVISIRDVG